MIWQLIVFAVIGAFAGLCSGLFGIGGGLITVPSLLLCFQIFGLGFGIHEAIGTSLVAMSFSTCSSMIRHAMKKNVVKRAVISMVPATVVGAILGAFFAQHISGKILQIFFACLVFALSLKFFLSKKGHHDNDPEHYSMMWLIFGCLGIAFIASGLGVGGGFLVVPLLTHLHAPLRKAIGTASVTSFTTTIVAAITYLLSPIAIYYPAVIAIAIFATIMAPIGAHIVHHAPLKILSRLFAFFLFAVGITLIFK